MGSRLFSIRPRGPAIPELDLGRPDFHLPALFCKLDDGVIIGLKEWLVGEFIGESRSASSLRFFARAALLDGLEGAIMGITVISRVAMDKQQSQYTSKLHSTLAPSELRRQSCNCWSAFRILCSRRLAQGPYWSPSACEQQPSMDASRVSSQKSLSSHPSESNGTKSPSRSEKSLLE